MKKVLSFFLVAGGISGLVVFMVILFSGQVTNLVGILLVLLVVAVFLFAAFIGVQLWRDLPSGRRWAPILFATQIPILASPALSYNWFTGLMVGPSIRFGSGDTVIGLAANVGAQLNFYVAQGGAGMVLGVNIFALVATILLLRAGKR